MEPQMIFLSLTVVLAVPLAPAQCPGTVALCSLTQPLGFPLTLVFLRPPHSFSAGVPIPSVWTESPEISAWLEPASG